jgi:hypothetical protein
MRQKDKFLCDESIAQNRVRRSTLTKRNDVFGLVTRFEQLPI